TIATLLPWLGVALLLPVKRLNSIVLPEASVTMAPPALSAPGLARPEMLLEMNSLSVMLALPAVMAMAPPPSPLPLVTQLLMNVLFVIVSGPLEATAPPDWTAELPVRVSLSRLSVPALRMPPPLLSDPAVIVRPIRLAFTPASTWKTRLALLPLMVTGLDRL